MAGREMAFHGEQHMQWLRAVMRVTANCAMEVGLSGWGRMSLSAVEKLSYLANITQLDMW